MNSHPILSSILIGYFLGSIPFGYMLVRVFRGADVRTTGSGNIGATNVARTSPALGVLTLLLDAVKGLCAVAIILSMFPELRWLAFLAAFSSICGHVFPVWLGFRGGKGVATGLGSLVLLTPKAVLIAIGIFLGIVALSRWIALASIVATAAVAVLAWNLQEACRSAPTEAHLQVSASPMFWLAAGSALVILKHHSNIRRLFAGTEPRFQLKHK
jgi:acyl phosphate:glycerol-3-phosphate acyltransferase